MKKKKTVFKMKTLWLEHRPSSKNFSGFTRYNKYKYILKKIHMMIYLQYWQLVMVHSWWYNSLYLCKHSWIPFQWSFGKSSCMLRTRILRRQSGSLKLGHCKCNILQLSLGWKLREPFIKIKTSSWLRLGWSIYLLFLYSCRKNKKGKHQTGLILQQNYNTC